MNYSKQDIRQGLDLKRKAQETPSSFGTVEGATERPTGGFLKQRMAGEGGARVLRMINDPKEQARTADWMQRFGLSNQGYEFNQARMMMENPQPQQEEQA